VSQGGCTPQKIAVGGSIIGKPTQMAQLGRAVTTLSAATTGPDTLLLAAPGDAEEGLGAVVLVVHPPYRGRERVAVSGIQLREEGAITLSPSVP
jgi:hypothetical protein